MSEYIFLSVKELIPELFPRDPARSPALHSLTQAEQFHLLMVLPGQVSHRSSQESSFHSAGAAAIPQAHLLLGAMTHFSEGLFKINHSSDFPWLRSSRLR